jgi:acyl-CoA thioesterase-2
MSASFYTGGESSDVQTEQPLLAGDPDALSPLPSDYLLGMDGRLPAQLLSGPWPTRYWVRSADHLPDSAVVHACALAHVSDAMTPLFPIECPPSRHGPTLSHSVYFHRPVQLDDWVLVDLAPGTIAGGRGFYRGTACAHSGAFVASFGQEAIYRSDLRRGCSAQSTDGLSPKGVRAP